MSDTNKLVIFDCDGTLVDSQHTIIEAMQSTFLKVGLPAQEDIRIRSTVGLSVTEAITMLRPDDDAQAIEDMSNIFKREFYRLRVDEAPKPDPLYIGARDAMDALRDAGYLLGVATGNSQRGLARVIHEHGLEGYFVTLQTADGHPSKPHPSMIHAAVAEAGADVASSIMVGDTSYDMMMARSAGAHAVGVMWGYHSDSELREGGAHHLLQAYTELPPVVDLLRNGS